ncbi:hypothetical protein [Mycolicibacterium moriokaense]|nr:hypothetical protein [Mycolicibacterium moriokaense]
MTSNQPWWLTWPVAEVAAAILPLFSHSAYQWDREARVCIITWCTTGSYKASIGAMNSSRSHPFKDPDGRAINEAMQALVRAGLLVHGDYGERTLIGLTRLGMHALQTNTVRQHLGLGEPAPGGATHDGR